MPQLTRAAAATVNLQEGRGGDEAPSGEYLQGRGTVRSSAVVGARYRQEWGAVRYRTSLAGGRRRLVQGAPVRSGALLVGEGRHRW